MEKPDFLATAERTKPEVTEFIRSIEPQARIYQLIHLYTRLPDHRRSKQEAENLAFEFLRTYGGWFHEKQEGSTKWIAVEFYPHGYCETHVAIFYDYEEASTNAET